TRVTLGVAAGGTEGLLAGVETALTRDLTLLADYDTRGVNVGARFAPSPNVQMDVARVSDGWAGSISLSTDLAPDRPHIGPVVLPQPQFSDGPQNLAERLQAVTCGLGMENVKALVGEGEHGETAVVYYENRTYLHSELTALWQVVAAVVAELPPSVARVCIITRKQGVPVFRFAVSPDDYVTFLNGEIPIGDFQPMCDVGHGTDSPVRLAGASGRTRIAQSTRYTADLAINPVVQTLIGSETAHLSQRYGVRPSLEVPLGHGLSINLSRQVRVGGSLDKNIDPFVRITDTVANVSALFRPTDYSVGRVAVGDLLGGRRGAAGEAVALVADGRSVLRGTAGWITEREYDDYRWFYVGDARYHIPRLDATATVTFGQYLEGDTGATVGLRKYLGDLEMDAQYRDTNYGRILMVGATLPIGSRKDRRPDPVRIRESSRFAQHFRAETEDPVTGDTSVVGASSIGNQLPLFDLTDEYLDRDRLNATYLWSHPEAILAGARRVLARR
ncbi:MAG TPA: YjbH domain-containing protein, partial [Armatimonadota bacterium]|nr:YjbH domain-containing protein [Armatimonadota bacterium]